jgi:DNA-binding NarL/FixJ family response regulator
VAEDEQLNDAPKPFKILIADDSKMVRQALAALITRNSQRWQVCGEAATSQQVVPKVDELRPDLVLLDLSLSVLNGVQLAEVLKKSNPSLLIVLMSEQHAAVMKRLADSLCVRGIAKSRLAFELVPLLNSLYGEAMNNSES